MEKRYPTLRRFSAGLKFFAAITLGLAILYFLFAMLSLFFGDQVNNGLLNAEQNNSSFWVALGALFSAAGTAFAMYATGEAIDLAINIEENTRATGIALNKLLSRQAPRPTPPVPAPSPNPDSLLNRAKQNEP